MLFTSISVPVPEHNVLRQKRVTRKDGTADIYVYQLLDSWKDEHGRRRTNRKRKMIGKIIEGTDGSFMHPNPSYYEIFGLPLPEIDPEDTKGPGRRPARVERTAAADVRYRGDSLADLDDVGSCWLMACDRVIHDLGLDKLLTKHFGADEAYTLARLAAMCAAGKPEEGWGSVLSDVQKYCQNVDALLTDEDRAPFFRDWMRQCQASSEAVCYQISPDFPQKQSLTDPTPWYFNCHLVCDSRSLMPLCYALAYADKDRPLSPLKEVLETARAVCGDDGRLMVIPLRNHVTPDHLKGILSLKAGFIAAQPLTEVTAVDDDELEQLRLNFSRSPELKNAPLPHDPELADEEELFGCTRSISWDKEPLKAQCYYSPEQAEADLLQISWKTPSENPAYDEEEKKAAGTFVLLTSPELELSQRRILKLMQERESDCIFFDRIWDHTAGYPVEVRSRPVDEGIFFVFFLSLIIKKELMRRMSRELKAMGRRYSFISGSLQLYRCGTKKDGSFVLIDHDGLRRPDFEEEAKRLLACL